MKNIFAYTAEGPMPEVLSLAESEGVYSMLIREKCSAGVYGRTVKLELPTEELKKLHAALGEELAGRPAESPPPAPAEEAVEA